MKTPIGQKLVDALKEFSDTIKQGKKVKQTYICKCCKGEGIRCKNHVGQGRIVIHDKVV